MFGTTQRFLAFFVVMAVSVFGVVVFTNSGAAEETHPPHNERLVAVSSNQDDASSLPIPLWRATSPDLVDVLQQEEALRAQEAAEAAAAALAAQRAAEAAQARPQVAVAAPAPTTQIQTSSSVDGACDGIDWVIPVYIVWRESHCNFEAVNYNGCGGWTCVGAYQFDLRHWIPRDQGGWGGCAGFGDWHVPDNQIECARQMSRNGTYLSPWGG